MDPSPRPRSLVECFADLPDPRVARTRAHNGSACAPLWLKRQTRSRTCATVANDVRPLTIARARPRAQEQLSAV